MITEFPEIDDIGIAFGGYPKDWFKSALVEATEKGYGVNNCDKAARLFYSGGSVDVNKELDKEYASKGLRMLKSVLGSFEPKHEDKMAVAEYIINCLEN